VTGGPNALVRSRQGKFHGWPACWGPDGPPVSPPIQPPSRPNRVSDPHRIVAICELDLVTLQSSESSNCTRTGGRSTTLSRCPLTASHSRLRNAAADLQDVASVKKRHPADLAAYVVGFSQTDTCWSLSLVNGSRFHPLQRSRNLIPASSAIKSSSEGHTYRNGTEKRSTCPSTISR